jgi:transcriptional regulator with XRE-family HTH domain
MDNSMAFWENVKKEIKRQNTTQEWTAKKAGISFNTFQGWISKKIYPRADDAVYIAEALNTSVEYLVTGIQKDTTHLLNAIRSNLPQIKQRLEEIAEAAGNVKPFLH